MKVQCDACENAVAAIMCCADEAALCVDCDKRVHAANRLANKHQRVPLLPSPKEGSKCDICQERAAFFFCLEDRALLCRDCDISIHTANELARKHTRFLLTGVRVGLENLGADEQAEAPSTSAPASLKGNASPFPPKPTSPVARVPVYQPAEQKPSKKKSSSTVPSSPVPDAYSGGGSGFSGGFGGGGSGAGPSSRGGGASSSGLRRGQSVNVNELPDSTVPVWSVDEILGIPNLADGYSLNDIGSTKGMDALMGDFDWTADLGMFDDLAFAESMHEVPNFDYSPSPGLVPSNSPSIPRKGGGSALKGKARSSYDMAPAVVPDSDDLFVVPDLGLQVPPSKRKRSNLDWH